MPKWKDWIAQATKKALDALYPPVCFACDAATEHALLCETCLSLLEPFSPESRCPMCLSDVECLCLLKKPCLSYADAAYVAAYPLLPLIDEIALSKPLAALAAQSYLAKNLPLPTSLIAASHPEFAKQLARFLNVPLKPSARALIVAPRFDPARFHSLATPGCAAFSLVA